MKLYHLISFTSTFLSFFVAYSYRKTKFNIFFLIMFVCDLTALILWQLFSVSAQAFWIPMHYLIVLAVNRDFLLKYKFWIALGLIPIIIGNYFTDNVDQHYVVLIGNFLILLYFIKQFIINFNNDNRLILFYILMIIYHLNVVLRFVAVIKDIEVGVSIYYAALISQIAIQVILIFVSKRMPVQSKLST